MSEAHGAVARRAVGLVMLTIVVGSAGPMLMSVPACAQTVREVFQTASATR